MSITYKHIETEPVMVEEPTLAIADAGRINAADALWTLITQQARDIQMIIKNRLDNLFAESEQLPPYTIEEIYSRIDESEKQMEVGETISGDDVHQQMLDYINNAYKL